MSYPFYDLYSLKPTKGDLLSTILVFEFEHITKEGRICVIMNFFSQPEFMGSGVQ